MQYFLLYKALFLGRGQNAFCVGRLDKHTEGRFIETAAQLKKKKVANVVLTLKDAFIKGL